MTLSAIASRGFELKGYTSGREVFFLPGDPGDTFNEGDAVYMNNGVLDRCTDSIEPQAIVQKTTIVPAATQYAAPAHELNRIEDAAEDRCLVPVMPCVAAGFPIYEVTFANQHDDTLAAYTPATPSVTLTVSPGADNDTNGAIIYVYEGPGRGEILIGADYTHTSLILTTHRVAKATLTTSSKVIILEGEGGGVGGIGFLGLCDVEDHNNLDVSDGYNDGNWLIWMDWRTAPGLLQNLKLRVIPSRALRNL